MRAALLSAALCVFLSLPQRGLAADSDSGWRFPLDPPISIRDPFRQPAFNWLRGNRGVVFSADEGQAVFAPAEGTVSFVGRVVDRDVLVITHDYRRSTFEPVTSELTVGTRVIRGERIGTVSHGPNGPFHWGVKVARDHYLDPLEQIVGRVILKPWDEPGGR